MIITIYKCDLCKEEHDTIYTAKNGLSMEIKNILTSRYKCSEVCSECFNTILNGFNEMVKGLIK